MRIVRAIFAISIVAGMTIPAFAGGAAAAKKHRTRSSVKATGKHAVKTKFQPRQRSIDDERATEIQAALIKAGYLSGSPTGHWDGASIAAMTKMQAANGWQTKLVPDSRALIKLGLGPAAPEAAPSQVTASLGVTTNYAYAR